MVSYTYGLNAIIDYSIENKYIVGGNSKTLYFT